MRDWVAALRDTIVDLDAPFDWGQNDCCQFARAYYFRVTGKDVGLPYDSQTGANRILAKYGSLTDLFTHLLGEPVSEAQASDIVIVRVNETDEAAGVFNGSDVWTVHPDHGLCRLPGESIVRAWQCL